MSILEILKVIVLGMVEGFTEWLPISSTGHLILVEDLIRPEVSAEFMEMFRVVIQLGAILAVVVMYFRRLNPFDPGKSRRQRAATWQLWMKILIACLPAAILGFLLDDWLDEHLFNGFVVALMLVLYGILFIVIENMNRFRQPVICLLRAAACIENVDGSDGGLFFRICRKCLQGGSHDIPVPGIVGTQELQCLLIDSDDNNITGRDPGALEEPVLCPPVQASEHPQTDKQSHQQRRCNGK